jgi:hypothetical protein
MTRKLSIPVTAVALAALIVGFTRPAAAHHSFAVFDMTKQQAIDGTVKKVDWTNPHVWVWVDVPTAAGGTETYGFEGMSPNYLARRGWSRTTLQTGMKVTVQYRPLKDGKPGGMLVSAKLPSGLLLTGGGAQPGQGQ